jgi:transcriptional regulator of arginine metabolism
MPNKKADQLREVRQAAIKHLLLEKTHAPIRSHESLVELLKAMGIPATQASVSRDLREIGAVWVKGHYELPSAWDDEEDPFCNVLGLIKSAESAGDHQIVIRTVKGAGPVVGEAIEEGIWEDLVGVVAGTNSVLLLTKHKFFQDLVLSRLKHYFDSAGEEEEPAIEDDELEYEEAEAPPDEDSE